MPVSGASDSELVNAFVGGDAAAMDELVSRYRTALFSWFVAQLGDRQAAEDLYQDVWLRIIRGASGFRDVSFRAWMWRIARNLVIDYRRKKRPDLALDAPLGGSGEPDALTMVDTVSDGRESVRDLMESEERRAALRSAVARLPELQRQIVYMRTVGQMAFKDIAEALGIPLNTALGRMHDATEHLRKLVKR